MSTISSMSSMAPRPLSDQLGLTNVSQHLREVVELGRRMVVNAREGRTEGPRCAFEPSFISIRPDHRNTSHKSALFVDIGGTHTKVVYRLNGKPQILLDVDNEHLKDPSGDIDRPLQTLFASLASKIAQQMPPDSNIESLGVVWSNAFSSKQTEAGVVTAILPSNRQDLSKKREWFNEGVIGGEDLGDLFRKALKGKGIEPSHMLFINDTVGAHLATNDAHAGVVLSSGGNATLLDGEGNIYNSELGGKLIIPHKYLTEADQRYMQKAGLTELSVENLSTGKWFDGLVAAYVDVMAETSRDATAQGLNTKIKSGFPLKNEEISALLRGDSTSLGSLANISDPEKEVLRAVAEGLLKRGAELGAVLAYLSLSLDLPESPKPGTMTVSLDSSMARNFTGFLDHMRETLNTLIGQDDATQDLQAQIVLVQPKPLPEGGSIPVPIQGLMNVL